MCLSTNGCKDYLAIGSKGNRKDNLQDGKFCNVQSALNIVSWMSNQKINKCTDVGYNLNNDHAEYKEYLAIGSKGNRKDNLQDGKFCNVQ